MRIRICVPLVGKTNLTYLEWTGNVIMTDTDPAELRAAILTVGCKEIADNYDKAVTEGENDDWNETDMTYFGFSPSLCECLEAFVEKNKEVIFD